MSQYAPIAVGAGFGLWFPIAFVLGVARHGRKGGVEDRRQVLDGLLLALFGVLAAYLWLPWDVVPRLLWALPVALTVYGVVLAVPLWRELPWLSGSRVKAAGTVVTAAVLGLVAVVGLG